MHGVRAQGQSRLHRRSNLGGGRTERAIARASVVLRGAWLTGRKQSQTCSHSSAATLTKRAHGTRKSSDIGMFSTSDIRPAPQQLV